MYKSLYFIKGLLFLGLLTVSCNKQLLNPVSESLLTTANAFTVAKDINLAVLGVYNRMQSRSQKDFELLEIPADNMWGAYFATAPGMDEIGNLSVSVENPKLNTFWKDTYNGIFRANTVLANIDVPQNYIGTQKDQYIGEAKFMRAMFYFDLVRVFGGVPAIATLVNVDESRQVARATEPEIYTLIIKDLEDAVAKLPAPTAIERGRASKGAALALLAKVDVYQKNWADAKKYIEQLTKNYSYSLLPKYGDLFKEETESNAEAIFSMPFVAGTNAQGLTYDLAPLGGIFEVITNGNRVARPTWNLRKAFEKGDTRFPVTIVEDWLPFAHKAGEASIWFPYFNKFIVPLKGATTSGLDIPLIRFADVVLLYAEALYNLDQKPEAVAQLNRVRQRAFGDATHNYTLADVPTLQTFMDKLLLERRLELAVENNRWFDLVRTDRFVSTLQNIESEYNNATGAGAVIRTLKPQAYMKYFPIPYEQIQLAGPGVLKQNAGY